ncbi:MAG: metalloregulator ArsR/SmtB family transcription factor [Acidobacteriota bacterium]|jgi:ArsR family transcriptional regulator|nr:metalloregulator ArsR/SmtB family transcription factor [Acidobacteriota bacterium]
MARTKMNREQIERISKALGDQTRLLIFEAIASREQMNCGEVVSLHGVTPATVSHHLKTLSDARLIECCREGQFVYNKAIPKTMDDYLRSLAGMIRRKRAAKRH